MTYDILQSQHSNLWYRGEGDDSPISSPAIEPPSSTTIALATESNIDTLKGKDPTIEVGDYLVDTDGTYTVKKCEKISLLTINKDEL